MKSDNRNLILFLIVTFVMVMVYETFVLQPMEKRREAELAQRQAVAAQTTGVAPNQPAGPHLTRAEALAAAPHIDISTQQLAGALGLAGSRLDDLRLTQYRETTAPHSPPVQLLSPPGAPDAYFAALGWVGANVQGLPDDSTIWTEVGGGALTPTHPIELTYVSPSGLSFRRTISVDPQYLFTITDAVTNTGAQPMNIAPYGAIERRGLPPTAGRVAMEGAIGMFDHVLKEERYQSWKKDGTKAYTSTGGWLGITDKYWMTVFAPPQGEALHARFEVTPLAGVDDYVASYVGAPRIVAPGATVSEATHVFAGAKVVRTLGAYGQQLGLFGFDKAVDWGILEILSKPVFQVLDFFAGYLARFGLGFGWAILALTISVRTLMLPAFNASYAMSTKMKKVQPEMKALQERFKGDPPALQKEMMGLYAREKINPVTGCIPMLLPLPVFYALNNVFNVTIEMRQASFGWVKDLSAPDPTTIWNLFGLIPWDPFHTGVIEALMALPFVGGIATLVLHLGAWPIIYATTMWLSLLTGPTMTGVDPNQQRLMRWMPWMFMIVLAQSAVGLVIYWSFSSIYTMVQQYVLMRRFKVENPVDAFFARLGPLFARLLPHKA